MDSTLGNHLLIRYRINGLTGSPIEYGGRVKTPRWVNQAESTRQVSGQKLFDMLTLDRILQETHAKTLEFRLFGFEIGNNDCHTYVQKILMGTGQKPSVARRFVKETDTWIGYHLVGRCVDFIKINKDQDIQRISSLYPGKKPTLNFFAKPKNKNIMQAIDDWGIADQKAQSPLS